MLDVDRPDAAPQEARRALAPHRVDVARSCVVEGHGAGKGSDDEQDLVGQDHEAAEIGVDQPEPQIHRRCPSGDLDRLRRTIADDDHPGHEGVEQAEADDRDHRGDRDIALGVLGLLAVDGGRLEADPRPEGEEDTDRGNTRGNTRAEGVFRQARECVLRRHDLTEHVAVRPALEEHAQPESSQEEHLEHKGHAEHTRREGHRVVGENRDDDDADGRDDHPVDVDARGLQDVLGCEVGESADE